MQVSVTSSRSSTGSPRRRPAPRRRPCVLSAILTFPNWRASRRRVGSGGTDTALTAAALNGRGGAVRGRAARRQAPPLQGILRRRRDWSRVERIIARVEVGEEGSDTRFVVTNLSQRNARALYQDLYCRRGQAENHIKSVTRRGMRCKARRRRSCAGQRGRQVHADHRFHFDDAGGDFDEA